MGGELAKGRFSVTANVNKEGKVYSVKLFDKANSEGNDAAMREFKNLKTLRHEKMVSLVDAFETDRFSMLQFSALPSTDVLSYIAERPFYTENLVCEIAGQVLDALEYIHWRGKVYLNLEPANILVCSGRSLGRSVQVKIANFETTQTVASSGTQIKGTYNFDYAAPEIIEEAKAYPQSDVWSLGVLLYVLMSGQLPFKGESPEETKDNILNVKFKFLKKIGDEMVFRGMAARFTALVTGVPEPEFEFFFNNKPLFPTDRIHIVQERTGLIRLSMAYVEESDIGMYRLRVWNKHGEATCEARLVYDGLEVQPGQSLGNLYQGFEKYTMGG